MKGVAIDDEGSVRARGTYASAHSRRTSPSTRQVTIVSPSGARPVTSPGRVTALSTAGEVRWRHPVGSAVSQVVPVGDRVFVGTDDLDYGDRSGAAGRVVALE
ncbi:PQQ-binding-like beta-propeller repeat protein [Halobellus sp. EA9]|uniref:PQQ-binding-like beta-propeller repeat protein n=1 Tax=Halobellus sp. EA9 TaxID=3421647 RepID=UPI003EB7623D